MTIKGSLASPIDSVNNIIIPQKGRTVEGQYSIEDNSGNTFTQQQTDSDTKFLIEIEDVSSYSLKRNKDILKENNRLRKYNEYLQGQMKLTKEIKQDEKAMKNLSK